MHCRKFAAKTLIIALLLALAAGPAQAGFMGKVWDTATTGDSQPTTADPQPTQPATTPSAPSSAPATSDVGSQPPAIDPQPAQPATTPSAPSSAPATSDVGSQPPAIDPQPAQPATAPSAPSSVPATSDVGSQPPAIDPQPAQPAAPTVQPSPPSQPEPAAIGGGVKLKRLRSFYDLVGRGEALKGDGSPEAHFALRLRAPGRTINAMALRAQGAPAPTWDTTAGNGAWLLVLAQKGKPLNQPDGALNLPLGQGELVADVLVQDDNSIASGNAKLELVIGFADGQVLILPVE
ncbi:hypothetical protein Deba_1463 [Desulfarculus baarsii DSM 2075]|uniref:Uncharacterized protein n=1 Tax=Desulfarculus baarsii (strain ATCC 33931 / DSM 2075 / LMG 7858 / VKM B-1802 / 2st14) TaxID=644282 RepID=E1QGY8_DESB2|nr:hypothetical protein [Desulfarculus baarsii]ADK84831.1 hypothetical protein Deba_1463 [Desulfarculus baarsii DSM 2075]